ncbi:MAG TPA: hypothetical protein VEB22_00355 [Phycisphaerales bacterium]|nr:hypothetical protein [Phycisphaerales bacterium]
MIPVTALALFVTAVAIVVGRPLLQPLGQPGRFARAMEDAIERQQPPGENGFPHLERAIEAAVRISDQIEGEFSAAAPGSEGLDYTGELPGGTAQVVELNREHCRRVLQQLTVARVWDDLDLAAKAPRAVRTVDSTSWYLSQKYYWLGHRRRLARINRLRMEVALERGDLVEFVRATESGLAIGRLSAPHQGVIHEVVGMAVQQMTLDCVRGALMSRALDERTLESLLAAVDRQRLRPPSHILDTERVVTLDAIEFLHTDDGRGDGYLNVDALKRLTDMGDGLPVERSPWASVPGIVLPRKAKTVSAANRFFDTLAQQTSAGASVSEIRNAAELLHDENKSEYNLAMGILLPALQNAVLTRLQCDARIEGVRLMIALQRYRFARGRYPATLAEAAPSFIVTIPRDPHSASMFCYRVVDASAPLPGDGYLLYCTGFDGSDDGGNAHKSPYDAFTVCGKGTDYIINSLD